VLFRSFHPTDSGGQIRTQQPRICRFVGQSPNRREPKVDGRCGIALLFQIRACSHYAQGFDDEREAEERQEDNIELFEA
jgi:hypothetical protein